jgi:hypothetical protein
MNQRADTSCLAHQPGLRIETRSQWIEATCAASTSVA